MLFKFLWLLKRLQTTTMYLHLLYETAVQICNNFTLSTLFINYPAGSRRPV